MDEVDGPDPYAAISDAVVWFHYVFWDDEIHLLRRLFGMDTPVEVLRSAYEIAAVRPDCDNSDLELWGRVKEQVTNPLFEQYVHGLYGSV